MSSDYVRTYDGQASERTTIAAWRDMFYELWEGRELIHRLVLRNIRGQVRQSFLGYIWIGLPPIATAIVFTMLRRAQIFNVPMGDSAMPYALFVLFGTTIWQFFTQVTMMATRSLSNSGGLVTKIYFPREILIFSSTGSAVMNLAIRSVVIVITCMLVGYRPCWQVVFAPVVLFPLLLFSLGLGLIFAPINTMMHDMARLLEFVFQFGMFLAPTVYPTPVLANVKNTWQLMLYTVHTLNPVSHFIYAVDTLAEKGHLIVGTGWNLSLIISIVVFLIGWRFFHVCEPFLAEKL